VHEHDRRPERVTPLADGELEAVAGDAPVSHGCAGPRRGR
jgi:hypothetical protein